MNGQKRKTAAVWAVLLTFMLLVTNVPVALAAGDDVVVDANLKQALIDAGAVADADGKLTEGEMAALSGELDLSGKSISDLTGLSLATGVTGLDLSNNDISDISELSGLTGLTTLDLSKNDISDISALAALTGLTSLILSDNEIDDISPLFDMDNPPETIALRTIDVTGNRLDIAVGTTDRDVIDALEEKGCDVIFDPQKPVAVTDVKLNMETAELCPGDTLDLSATVIPANATNKEVAWNSDKTSVATVAGGKVTAVAVGVATVTVTTNDGSKTDTCTITVKSAKLTSSDYYVNSKVVRGVPARTKVSDFKPKFDNDASNVKIYNGSKEYSDTYVKTGLTVKLVVGGVVRASRIVVVEGDVSGDSKITIDDYSRLKLHLLKKRTMSSPYTDAGDYNRDARLDVADYVRIRLNILGLGDTGGPLPENLPKVSDSRIRKFLDIALDQLGEPYVWGAEGPDEFDCSGFVYYCLNKAGYKVGRSSANSYSKYSKWKYVDKDDLKPGDLMFYISDSDPTRIGHIGIYLGNGYHVHASSDYQCIIICGVEGWYERALSHGRRVFD